MICKEPGCGERAAYVTPNLAESKGTVYAIDSYCNYHGPLAYIRKEKPLKISDFTPQTVDATQEHAISQLTLKFRLLEEAIEDTVPSSAHRTAALRKLLEAKMMTVHSISHQDQQS